MEVKEQLTVKDWLDHLQLVYEDESHWLRKSIDTIIASATLLIGSLIAFFTLDFPLRYFTVIGMTVSGGIIAETWWQNYKVTKMMDAICKLRNDILLKNLKLKNIREEYKRLCQIYYPSTKNPLLFMKEL